MKLLIKALQMLEETVRIVEWAFCKRCETEFSGFFFNPCWLWFFMVIYCSRLPLTCFTYLTKLLFADSSMLFFAYSILSVTRTDHFLMPFCQSFFAVLSEGSTSVFLRSVYW